MLILQNIENMIIPFVKYQGTGNDFIIIDQRNEKYLDSSRKEIIQFLCDRRFGIGGDGLMLLENSKMAAFHMTYFNSDGRESSMCGNGGRCMAHFAHSLGLFDKETVFSAVDGLHEVLVNEDNVSLKMCDVGNVKTWDTLKFTLFTGSPHFVKLVKHIPTDIKASGGAIRYSPPFKDEGINVNFVRYDHASNAAFIATYERGVEDETLSCGTGATAAALICGLQFDAVSPVRVHTKGGDLQISFNKVDNCFFNIWLSGPATFVFEGQIHVSQPT